MKKLIAIIVVATMAVGAMAQSSIGAVSSYSPKNKDWRVGLKVPVWNLEDSKPNPANVSLFVLTDANSDRKLKDSRMYAGAGVNFPLCGVGSFSVDGNMNWTGMFTDWNHAKYGAFGLGVGLTYRW